jgi:hypothetical protein
MFVSAYDIETGTVTL